MRNVGSVFIDPLCADTVLVSSNSSTFPFDDTEFVDYGADHFVSTDGGATWGGDVEGAGGEDNAGDPTVAIDLDQRFFVGYIAPGLGQGVAWSDDPLSSFTHVQVVSPTPEPPLLLYPETDKGHLWVDNSPASPYVGRLYHAWTWRNHDDQQIVPIEFSIGVSYSTNHGLSWVGGDIPGDIITFGNVLGVNLQTAPDGTVYAVWSVKQTYEHTLGFSRSTDGGASWEDSWNIIPNIKGLYSTLLDEKTMGVNSWPSMTVDPSGNIYVVWTNRGVPGTNTGDPDIYLIKSADGGDNWSTPSRVN